MARHSRVQSLLYALAFTITLLAMTSIRPTAAFP